MNPSKDRNIRKRVLHIHQ